VNRIAIVLVLALLSCGSEFRAVAETAPYQDPDLAGACRALLQGWLSVRDRCGITLPDASDDCLDWPLSESCAIARCGWRLDSADCGSIDDTRAEFCPCLAWIAN